MRKKVLSVILLLGIFTTGCGNADEGNAETSEAANTSGASEISETVGITEKDVDTEETLFALDEFAESESSNDSEVETVEYSYEDLYLSVDIPNGWKYEIKTAEDMVGEDVTCAIDFWSAEFPDTVFELSYWTSFGMCGTGVTIEEFTLDNGLGGYRYTETIEDTLWLTITLSNPSNNLSGGTYLISASPELTVWDTMQSEFEQILNSVWVGPREEELTDDSPKVE